MYILVFIASPREIRWALSTTMSRLLLHVAPLAMLATAVHVFEGMEAQPRVLIGTAMLERRSEL